MDLFNALSDFNRFAVGWKVVDGLLSIDRFRGLATIFADSAFEIVVYFWEVTSLQMPPQIPLSRPVPAPAVRRSRSRQICFLLRSSAAMR